MIGERSAGRWGVSGMSVYVPPYRVRLPDWCGWTGRPRDQVAARVGEAFRLCGPRENVYTMAANAALRLIRRYDVDPARVGFLALGTESSTDNAAGAVVIKGMLDRALPRLGLPRLSRACEVPEFKHACLGGVYATKGALRYLALDGRGRQAIVVCADLALYERGSSGEETQGAGAVALLLEEDPALFSVDLEHAGSAAEYRGPDFRKPLKRPPGRGADALGGRALDYPVFNGRYTTVCYIDEVIQAVGELLRRRGQDARALYHEVDRVFLHRPYARMPANALAALYVWGLHANEEHRAELARYCAELGCDAEKVLAEMRARPDLFAEIEQGRLDGEVYPEAMKLVRRFRSTAKFQEVVESKMALGAAAMMELGNLYAASLPAWLAAGFEEAWRSGLELAGRTLLAVGYGSGDAAEAMLLTVAERWREAASRIGVGAALAAHVDLDRRQYERLHDGLPVPDLPPPPAGGFTIDRVGQRRDASFHDEGVEYYRWDEEAPAAAPAGLARARAE